MVQLLGFTGSSPMQTEQIRKILSSISKHDLCGWVIWDDQLIHFSIICNDVFFWGCADCEDIATDDDIALLDKCFEDTEMHGEALYCARRRKERPQGAFYKYLNSARAPLYS